MRMKACVFFPSSVLQCQTSWVVVCGCLHSVHRSLPPDFQRKSSKPWISWHTIPLSFNNSHYPQFLSAVVHRSGTKRTWTTEAASGDRLIITLKTPHPWTSLCVIADFRAILSFYYCLSRSYFVSKISLQFSSHWFHCLLWVCNPQAYQQTLRNILFSFAFTYLLSRFNLTSLFACVPLFIFLWNFLSFYYRLVLGSWASWRMRTWA